MMELALRKLKMKKLDPEVWILVLLGEEISFKLFRVLPYFSY